MNVFSLLVVGLTVFFKGFVNSETSIQKIEGTYFTIKEKIGRKKNNIEWSKESYLFPQGPYPFSCDMTNTITCLADGGNILFTLKKNEETLKVKRTKDSNTGYAIHFQVVDSYNVTTYLAGYKFNAGKENTSVTMLSIVGTLSGIMIMFGDKIFDYCKNNKKCNLLLSSKHTQNNTTNTKPKTNRTREFYNNSLVKDNENTNNDIGSQSPLQTNPTNTKPKTNKTREFYNKPKQNNSSNNKIEIEMIEKDNNDNSDEEKVIEEEITKNGMTENENITNNNNNNYGKNNNKPEEEESDIHVKKLMHQIYDEKYLDNLDVGDISEVDDTENQNIVYKT